jgi:lipopolysaccharide transport system permease protein
MYWPGFALSVVSIATLTATAVWYFRRMERTFADVI